MSKIEFLDRLTKINFSFSKQLLAIVAFVSLALYFLNSHPLTTNDTYFHLSVGREVFQTHKIPTQDNFVFGSVNTNYVSAEWMTGLVFYVLTENFGIQSLFLLRIVCGLLTIFFLYRTLRLFTSNYWLITAAILIVGCLLPFRLSTRPEMFSLFFLALINYSSLHFYFKKKLALATYSLPLVFLLWPNLHGISPIGFALFTFFTFIMFYKYKDKKLLTIYLVSLFLYIPQYQLILSFLHAGSFSQYITEFASLWVRIFPSEEFKRFYSFITFEIYIYLFILAGYIFFLLKVFKKQNLLFRIASLIYLVLLLSPLQYFRLIVPILVIVIPFFVYLCQKGIKQIPNLYAYILNGILVLIIFASTIMGYTLGGTKAVELFPQPAMEAVKSTLSSKRLFTIYFWNDYLYWHIPTVKTYADVMTQYRTEEDMDDERMLHSANSEVSELVKKYNIDTVVSTRQDAVRYLGISRTPVYNLPDWQLVYIDNTAVVYARKDIIKNNALDLSAINPNIKGSIKFDVSEEEKAIHQLKSLLKFNNKNDFAWEQLIYYQFNNKKDLAKAKQITQEAMKALPDDPFISFILAAIYLQENDCQKATQYVRISLSKNDMDKELESSSRAILNNCKRGTI